MRSSLIPTTLFAILLPSLVFHLNACASQRLLLARLLLTSKCRQSILAQRWLRVGRMVNATKGSARARKDGRRPAGALEAIASAVCNQIVPAAVRPATLTTGPAGAARLTSCSTRVRAWQHVHLDLRRIRQEFALRAMRRATHAMGQALVSAPVASHMASMPICSITNVC